MKRFLIVVFIILITYVLNCKNSGKNDSYGICTVEGIVTLDGQPCEGINIEYGFAYVRGSTIGTQLVWSSQTLKTNANGYYSFSKEQVNDRYDYHVRAQHPQKGYWRDYVRGTIMGGKTITHNFSFVTE